MQRSAFLICAGIICTISTASALVTEQRHASRPRNFWIGTQQGSSNVVSNFQVLPAWKTGEDLASTIGPERLSSSFFLKPSSDTYLRGVQIATTRPDVLSARLGRGHGLASIAKHEVVLLKGGSTLALPVHYRCHGVGDVDMLLTLEIGGGPTIEVPWKKTCTARIVNQALMVAATAEGAAAKSELVVVRGTTLWNSQHEVATATSASKFTVSLDPSAGHRHVKLAMPKAWTAGACAATIDADSALRQMRPASVEHLPEVGFAVRYSCAWRGNCKVGVELAFHSDEALFEPARWEWTKKCDGVASGVDIDVVESATQLNATSDAKMMLQRGTHRMLVDGQPTSQVKWRADAGLQQHRVLVQNNAEKSLQAEVPVAGVEVRCLSQRHCSADLQAPAPKVLLASRPSGIDVAYTCRMSGSSLVELVIKLDHRDDIKLLWVKDCSVWSDSAIGILFAAFALSLLFVASMTALLRAASLCKPGSTSSSSTGAVGP
mmetsp:Transcript_64892/g.154975  ORF Transcript_64892/g.154975 Transcript_64892/m.154975 type:complete len:491 (-) Transcript_64892:47-1519(-)|eukprot:CAMPEP_0178404110 /NCGR_PEP_ID=MMETSP0689_2-20121128/17711_1 /TAXON_ID=160604 /ORGANISM="Amphidinium massartii, Strain CS-259" /LENGTH=490 /DNA_ID=CAMNT_0020025077 /DNA_START=119 /DNA_END=1591 /DNA_ORIENTATION=+